MWIQFLGAAKTVTGSRILLNHHNKNILIDCGLFQGPKILRELNWSMDPIFKTVDSILLTHAHLDHCGYIPVLVKNGFTGKIFTTHATRELARVILTDSAHLQEEDAQFANLTGHSHHKPALPLYTVSDVEKSFQCFSSVEREKWYSINSEIQFQFIRSGHILGSSFIQVSCNMGNGHKLITFSGDLGNNRSLILKSPQSLPYTDYLVLESTYGDRDWVNQDVLQEFENHINKIIDRGGILLIPSFSVGRAQEVLYVINYLKKTNRIDDIPVYLDSPMANRATEIYSQFSDELQLKLEGTNFILPTCFQKFSEVKTSLESSALAYNKKPKIILSASGMLTGGRVMHHLKYILPNPNNAVLFVGYQAPETKGRLLREGISSIRIHHQEIPVKCEIISSDAISAHAWGNDLIEWITSLKGKNTKIFLNHGEIKSIEKLAARIKNELNLEVIIPEHNQKIDL